MLDSKRYVATGMLRHMMKVCPIDNSYGCRGAEERRDGPRDYLR